MSPNVIVQYKLGEGVKMSKYEIILYWSDEDQAFIAELPELPGCAADGATRQEAIANAEVVMEEWIETARELGRAIPEPKADCSSLEDGPPATGCCRGAPE